MAIYRVKAFRLALQTQEFTVGGVVSEEAAMESALKTLNVGAWKTECAEEPEISIAPEDEGFNFIVAVEPDDQDLVDRVQYLQVIYDSLLISTGCSGEIIEDALFLLAPVNKHFRANYTATYRISLRDLTAEDAATEAIATLELGLIDCPNGVGCYTCEYVRNIREELDK